METEVKAVKKREDGLYEAEFCEAITVTGNTVHFETHEGKHSWKGGIREFHLKEGEIKLAREKDFTEEHVVLDDSHLDLIAGGAKLFTAECRKWIEENLL